MTDEGRLSGVQGREARPCHGLIGELMSKRQFPLPLRVLLLLALGLAPLAGCAGGVGKLNPVEGKVTVGGAPLKAGDITFIPDGKTLPGTQITGKIDSDSKFKMTTNGKAGVPAGKYKVTVNTIVAQTTGAGDPMPAKPGAAAAPPQRQANEKYESADKTDLLVTVPSENYDLKLTR